MTPLIVLLAFALALAFNFLAAVGTRACADGRRLRAANADLLLSAVGMLALWSLLTVGWWLAVPELLGGWLGTYLGTGWRA